MSRQFLTLTGLLGLCVFVSGPIPADDQKKADVITTVGEYKPFDGKLALKIFKRDGRLTLAVTRPSNPTRAIITNLPTKEGAFWLVYAETATKVWFFREPDLVELEFTEQAANTRTVTGSVVLKRAPKALLDSLPKDVQERLKGE